MKRAFSVMDQDPGDPQAVVFDMFIDMMGDCVIRANGTTVAWFDAETGFLELATCDEHDTRLPLEDDAMLKVVR